MSKKITDMLDSVSQAWLIVRLSKHSLSKQCKNKIVATKTHSNIKLL